MRLRITARIEVVRKGEQSVFVLWQRGVVALDNAVGGVAVALQRAAAIGAFAAWEGHRFVRIEGEQIVDWGSVGHGVLIIGFAHDLAPHQPLPHRFVGIMPFGLAIPHASDAFEKPRGDGIVGL